MSINTVQIFHLYVLVFVLLIKFHSTGSQISYQEPFYKGAREAILKDGGYEGVVVAISPQVPEDEELINRIIEVFTDFSNYLFQVSRHRTFLREVRILIPLTWSDNTEYVSAVSERFEESDIRIDYPPDEGTPNRNLPYTNKPTFCGSQGFYIHLTPEYLKNEINALLFGSYEKVLTHEWAHYRWGVFDEYPRPLSDDPHFYESSSGSIEGVRCTTAITGQQKTLDKEPCTFTSEEKPEENCRFVDDRNSTPLTASLMYKQFLDQITEFCDDDERVGSKVRVRHNAEAPNHHNIQCHGRSVWKVMSEHLDFSENSGRVNNMATHFVRVRERPARYVLVIDTSASMTYRLSVLRQACYIFIHQVLLDGESLAIVEFNDNAATLKELTVIDAYNRDTFVRKLPFTARGSTSIASGVLEALQVLNKSSELDVLGGRLIVLTDGNETVAPFIKDIIEQTDNVLIHTIAIGDDVDQDLEILANRAGGRQFFHPDASTALFDIFSQFGVESRGANSEELVSHYRPYFAPGETEVITFVIDNTLRGGIVAYVGVQASLLNKTFSGPLFLDIELRSPSGNSVIQNNYETLVSLFILTTTSTEEGEWTLILTNRDQNNLNISILVLAEIEERPVSLSITSAGLWAAADISPPQVQTAYLTLARGYNPVIDPEVTAVVETPMGAQNIQLFDDGIGEDITRGDGVFSGFFTRFTASGRYNVQFSVRGEGRIVKSARVGIFAAVDPSQGEVEWNVEYEAAGDVQRTITGGSFTCNNQQTCRARNNYGPYRVTNLAVRNINRDNRTFDLVFSAPGADLMDGTASRYDIRYSSEPNTFLKRFTSGTPIGMTENSVRPFILQGNLSQPLEARGEETFKIMLPALDEHVVYFFALTASDSESLESPMSNIVSVSAIRDTSPPHAKSQPPLRTTTAVTPIGKPGGNTGTIIFVSVLLLLLFLLIVVTALLLLSHNKIKQQKQRQQQHKNTTRNTKGKSFTNNSLGSMYETVQERGELPTLPAEINTSYSNDFKVEINGNSVMLANRDPTYAHHIVQDDDAPYLEACSSSIS